MGLNVSFRPDNAGERNAGIAGGAVGAVAFAKVLGPSKEIREADKAIDTLLKHEGTTLKKLVRNQLPIEDVLSVVQHNVTNRVNVVSQGMQAARPSYARMGVTAALGAAAGWALMVGGVNFVQGDNGHI